LWLFHLDLCAAWRRKTWKAVPMNKEAKVETTARFWSTSTSCVKTLLAVLNMTRPRSPSAGGCIRQRCQSETTLSSRHCHLHGYRESNRSTTKPLYDHVHRSDGANLATLRHRLSAGERVTTSSSDIKCLEAARRGTVGVLSRS